MKKQLFLISVIFYNFLIYGQIQLDSVTICGQSTYTISLQNPGSINVWTKNGENEIIISQNLTVNSSGWYHVYTTNPGGANDISVCNTFNAANNYTSMLNVPAGYLISSIQNALWGTPNTNCLNPTPSSCNLNVSSIVSRSLIGHKNHQYYSGSFPDPCNGTQKYLFLKYQCTPYIHDSIYVGFIPSSTVHVQDVMACNDQSVSVSLNTLYCDTTFEIIDSLNLPVNNTTISSTALIKGQLYRIKVKNTVSYGGGSGNQKDGAYTDYPISAIPYVSWKFNGNEPGPLQTFRPKPDGYNSNHIYYFYFLGDGNSQDFGAYDCCLGDNSGFFTFVIEKVNINSNCGLFYKWSNGQTGDSNNIIPSNVENIIYLSNGAVSCAIDSFFITNGNSSYTLNETAIDSYSLNGQTYTQSGTYTQIIPNAAGCDSTITLNLTLSFSGIDELFSSIKIYPNPTTDKLTVEGNFINPTKFSIRDAIGKEVLKGIFINSDKNTIDLENIARGSYNILIDENKIPLRIIKN